MSEHGTLVAARYGVARSAKWPAAERAHVARSPHCTACRRPGLRVEVHHIFPFDFRVRLGRADLELDERNLITLCAESDARGAGDHHFLLGHFGDYESMNLHVRAEAAGRFHGMTAVELRANEGWRKLAEGRPAHLGEMSRDARRELRETMNREMPGPAR